MYEFPSHMWLAGDGEGVTFVCEGDCSLPDEALVIAAYGDTATTYYDIPRFGIHQLDGFVEFMHAHGRTCRRCRGVRS